jgi:hypothetical protein
MTLLPWKCSFLLPEDTNRLAQFLSEYCAEWSISPPDVVSDDLNPDLDEFQLWRKQPTVCYWAGERIVKP